MTATQVGKMELSFHARDYPPRSASKCPRKPYDEFFIDQAGSVKVAGFLCEFMDLDSVLVHKHAKHGLGQYPAILTSHLINNPYTLLGHVISSVSFIQVMLCVTTIMAVVRSCALLNTEVS